MISDILYPQEKKTMKNKLTRPSLNNFVRDYIIEYILENNLNPGDQLPPETQLVGQLGLGRSSIREAVKILQSIGIIEVRHGSGLFVRENNFDPIREIIGYGLRFDNRTLKEITEIRLLLEKAAIEEVVRKIGPRDIATLEEVLVSWQRRIDSGEDHLQADKEFHRALYSSLDNVMLLKLLEEFWVAFEHFDFPDLHKDKPPTKELEDHRTLLDAVRSGDPALASSSLQEHFRHLRESIRNAEEERKSPGGNRP